MGLVGAVLGWVLTAFIVVLVARMVLDWAGVVTRGPRWVGRARMASHAVTEPVIAPVRRVLPPMRTGGLAIDLAFTVVFIVALILRAIVFAF